MPRAVRRVVTAAVERGVASAGIAVVRALDRDVIGQGHHPRGAAESVPGWVFAHRPSNRQRNGWVVSLLGVQPADRVLEIGFGPGLAVAELVGAGAGHVYGIDHSGVMLRQASRRNAAAIRAGRVTLINASVDQLPPALDGPFDAILAVNSLGFWPAPAERLAELRRRSEEHTSELQSRFDLVCRLLLEKNKKQRFHVSFLTKKKISNNN